MDSAILLISGLAWSAGIKNLPVYEIRAFEFSDKMQYMYNETGKEEKFNAPFAYRSSAFFSIQRRICRLINYHSCCDFIVAACY